VPRPPRFTDELTGTEREAYAELVAHLRTPPAGLRWYRDCGRVVSRIVGDRAAYGANRVERLAEALDLSTATLYKPARFAAEFTADDVTELDRLGLSWTVVSFAFSLPTSDRMDFLRKAARENWTAQKTRFAAQQRTGGPKLKGRPRKRVESRGPLLDLAELLRRTQAWREHVAAAWAADGEGSDLAELKAMVAAGLDDTTKRRLTELKAELRGLAREARHLQHALCELVP
jgi:hypothetical protein